MLEARSEAKACTTTVASATASRLRPSASSAARSADTKKLHEGAPTAAWPEAACAERPRANTMADCKLLAMDPDVSALTVACVRPVKMSVAARESAPAVGASVGYSVGASVGGALVRHDVWPEADL